MRSTRRPVAGTVAAPPRFPKAVTDQAFAPDLTRAPSVGHRARDLTLARTEDTWLTTRLFWLLAVLPAAVAIPATGIFAALPLVPLQLLAGIAAGTAVARLRACGVATVAAMAISGTALAWASLALA